MWPCPANHTGQSPCGLFVAETSLRSSEKRAIRVNLSPGSCPTGLLALHVNSPPIVVMNLKRLRSPFGYQLTGRMSSRRFTEIRGGLIRPVKWEFNVFYLSKTNKYKGVVRIDKVALMGSEGENTIGTPRDFNSCVQVVAALDDPRRQSYLPLSLTSPSITA
jgi:hypothetical protein